MINNIDVRKLLALILVISYVILIAALCFLPAKTIESDTVKTLLGSLSALVALAGNFYFTSSAGNDGKDKTIAAIATGGAAPPTPAVPATPPNFFAQPEPTP